MKDLTNVVKKSPTIPFWNCITKKGNRVFLENACQIRKVSRLITDPEGVPSDQAMCFQRFRGPPACESDGPE